MILVDTSVWVDHLRFGDGTLAGLLESGHVLVHPEVSNRLVAKICRNLTVPEIGG